jgi:hypothetical protein
MATGKHYFIEQRPNGQFAATPKGGTRAAGVFDNQHQAIAQVKQWNPNDRPDVERVRNTNAGDRDKWRPAR